jgi:hypothetical protein
VSLRTRVLPVFERLRALAGPDRFDIRTARLVIATRTWAGGYRDADPPTPATPRYVDVLLELPPIYEIVQVSTREIASSGGLYEMGDIKVGPITPRFTRADGTTGGFTESELKPTPSANGIEIIYMLVGAHAGEYQLVELRSLRPFGYELVLRRQETTP